MMSRIAYGEPCPHCNQTLDWLWRDRQSSFLLQCHGCQCLWALSGEQIHSGASCPKLKGRRRARL